MPSSYWSYAILTTVTLINLLPTSVLAFSSPWSKLHSSTLDISQLKVFGCAYYPHLRPYTPYKLAPKTIECIFPGYPVGTKGYLCLDLATKHLYTSKHVLFNEPKFPFSSLTSHHSPPSFSPISSDLPWFSNLLYLHSINQPSVLGPYSVLHLLPLLCLLPLYLPLIFLPYFLNPLLLYLLPILPLHLLLYLHFLLYLFLP